MYDVAIIGSGPGGYVCAIRAAQLGLKVALIEKDARLGGTCLNVGCIPSKTLLSISEHYHAARTHFNDVGINIGELSLDVAKMQKKRSSVVDTSSKGVAMLMKKNKVEVFNGHGRILAAGSVEVVPPQTDPFTIQANKIVIATGSKPVRLPFAPHHPRVLTSTEVLELDHVPKSMVIIGGGVIGIELGSVWSRLGTQVTVIEAAPKILGAMDAELSTQMQKILTKGLAMKFHIGKAVKGLEADDNEVRVHLESETITAEYVLVSVGRVPVTEGLGLDTVGILLDKRGRIEVDDHCQTKAQGIYAIGDVVRGPMLAHKAEDEGVAVAEHMTGKPFHVNMQTIPGVVYTHPEMASVGPSEEELKEFGRAYKAGKFSFRASGRARASDEMDGLVKVLTDPTNGEILAVHILGPRAADMIMEAVTAIEFKATAEDIARICHAHPTFSEAIKEASLDAIGRVMHS